MIKRICCSILLALPCLIFSQDDLLGEIDTLSASNEYETAAFKGLKIVNFETTKMVPSKRLYFVVAHRFGSIQTGIEDFFGLDQAVTRLQFVYGISEAVNVGISRSSFQQTYEGSLKLRFAQQRESGLPINVVWFNGIFLNGSLDDDVLPCLRFVNRLSYSTQLLISSKLNRNLSLELAPTFFHDNLAAIESQNNSQYALGFGGRYKVSNRVSINMDYGLHLNRASDSPFRNPLSIGVDIETGGHVFQLHFTNAQPMNVHNFLGRATGDWADGDVYFGFNLVRIF